MRIIFTLFTLLSCLSLGAHANNANYSIRGIEVDQVGANSTEARKIALAQGQEQAFKQLIKRLAPATNLDELVEFIPELAEEEKNTTIANMVRGLDVHNESVTSRRYHATLDIHFQPEYVKDFLKRNEIAYQEASSTTMLVLPVQFENPSQQPVVNVTTAWGETWQTLAQKQSFDLINFVLPQASDPLLSQLNIAQLLAKNYRFKSDATMQRLLRQYDASHIVFTAARQEQGEQTMLVTIARLFGEKKPLNFSEKSPTTSPASAMANSAFMLASRIQGQQALLSTDTIADAGHMEVTIPIHGHQDWIHTQQKLNRLSFLRNWKLYELSSRNAVIHLTLANNPTYLGEAFAKEGFYLEQHDGKLMLSNATAAPDASFFGFTPR